MSDHVACRRGDHSAAVLLLSSLHHSSITSASLHVFVAFAVEGWRSANLIQELLRLRKCGCCVELQPCFLIIIIIIIVVVVLRFITSQPVQFFPSPHWVPVSDPTVPPVPPRNLKVFNATTSSLTAKWDPAPSPVQGYRLTYRPAAGGEPLTVRQRSFRDTWKHLNRVAMNELMSCISLLPKWKCEKSQHTK